MFSHIFLFSCPFHCYLAIFIGCRLYAQCARSFPTLFLLGRMKFEQWKPFKMPSNSRGMFGKKIVFKKSMYKTVIFFWLFVDVQMDFEIFFHWNWFSICDYCRKNNMCLNSDCIWLQLVRFRKCLLINEKHTREPDVALPKPKANEMSCKQIDYLLLLHSHAHSHFQYFIGCVQYEQ